MLSKLKARQRRHKRIRTEIQGTKDCPRLCVFRSLKHIYLQLIDDEKRKTIVFTSDLELKKIKGKMIKKDKAKEVGKLVAQKAKEKKITKIVFDRGGYKFHGRVKAVADGAREGGLKF
jgi:large subunit ribosomal protein L18